MHLRCFSVCEQCGGRVCHWDKSPRSPLAAELGALAIFKRALREKHLRQHHTECRTKFDAESLRRRRKNVHSSHHSPKIWVQQSRAIGIRPRPSESERRAGEGGLWSSADLDTSATQVITAAYSYSDKHVPEPTTGLLKQFPKPSKQRRPPELAGYSMLPTCILELDGRLCPVRYVQGAGYQAHSFCLLQQGLSSWLVIGSRNG
jgi:hypothetical protein